MGFDQLFKIIKDSSILPQEDTNILHYHTLLIFQNPKATSFSILRVCQPTNPPLIEREQILLNYALAECIIRPKSYYDNRQRNYN